MQIFCVTIIAQTSSRTNIYNNSGSLAIIDINNNNSNTSEFNSANPYYVAQNISPAPIDYPTTSPSTLLPSATATYSPQFDPYAITDSVTPTTNLPDPSNTYTAYSKATTSSSSFDNFFPETVTTMRKFREATHVGYQYMPRGNSDNINSFGMQELDIRMQFAIPCRFIPDYQPNSGGVGSVYIAPGGSLYWWNGPGRFDVNANGFAAYIDFGIKPQITEFFSLESW
ncbi:MAG: hypothetical protein LBK06_00300, partial [Planctomycetaceae bacterium]|nr:hypothetical protein [Planctomycetaceae bacterium]